MIPVLKPTAAEPVLPRRRMRKPLFQQLFPYLLILPTLVFVAMFTLLPSVSTVVDSTLQPGRRASDPAEFVGLDNYISLFNPEHHIGSRFLRILGNTVVFTLATVVIGAPLSLGLALLLNRRVRWRGL